MRAGHNLKGVQEIERFVDAVVDGDSTAST